ncbi:hypothetical protein ACFWY5_38130 [Nonomuraea sp. NPDC059007]|uniref:hypothetical protein n=1 Tax=Nonomuraea sp. NPDC059007 TaxID=3346692 RepID=UPI0036A65537
MRAEPGDQVAFDPVLVAVLHAAGHGHHVRLGQAQPEVLGPLGQALRAALEQVVHELLAGRFLAAQRGVLGRLVALHQRGHQPAQRGRRRTVGSGQCVVHQHAQRDAAHGGALAYRAALLDGRAARQPPRGGVLGHETPQRLVHLPVRLLRRAGRRRGPR